MNRLLFIFFFCTISSLAYSQNSWERYSPLEKENLIHSFDGVEYFEDSTIKVVYKLKNYLRQGYSIEFNQFGQPISIGKYYKGDKYGIWVLNSGHDLIYNAHIDTIEFTPGCGTAIHEERRKFKSLYNQLLNKTTILFSPVSRQQFGSSISHRYNAFSPSYVQDSLLVFFEEADAIKFIEQFRFSNPTINYLTEYEINTDYLNSLINKLSLNSNPKKISLITTEFNEFNKHIVGSINFIYKVNE